MPSLDDLKKRIKSVKSTQKITKAMKMVAAAKLRKAQESAEKGRPYSQKMQNIILNLTKSISDTQNAPKLLVGTGQDKTYLCVVLSADRGLCGGFNSNICKLAKTNFKKIFTIFSFHFISNLKNTSLFFILKSEKKIDFSQVRLYLLTYQGYT